MVAAGLPVGAGIAATELEIRWRGRATAREAVWTGSIAGEHMSGRAKVNAIENLGLQCGLDLAQSYAYGDSHRDIPMLERVGHAMAVNPTARLMCRARLRGWVIRNWGAQKNAQDSRSRPPNAKRQAGGALTAKSGQHTIQESCSVLEAR